LAIDFGTRLVKRETFSHPHRSFRVASSCVIEGLVGDDDSCRRSQQRGQGLAAREIRLGKSLPLTIAFLCDSDKECSFGYEWIFHRRSEKVQKFKMIGSKWSQSGPRSGALRHRSLEQLRRHPLLCLSHQVTSSIAPSQQHGFQR